MSNVKIILVGDSAEGLKQAPLGMWYAKKMRADGGKHGLVRSFVPAEGVLFRVLLDDYTGDKCYIEAGAAPCPLIQYSGYLDAYSGVYDMDTAGGRAALAMQNAAEDAVERLVNNVDVHVPMMSGIRKVPAYDPSKDALPTLPPGSVLSSDTYPIVSVPRDTHDGDFRDLFTRYKPSRFTGLMRKVMQCTFGSGAWYDISYMGTSDPDGSGLPPQPQRKLRVNFKFTDCYGVVLAPGADGSKGAHYFLIHIEPASVSYVPADFCVHKVTVDGVDDYAPVLKAIHQTQTVTLGTFPALAGSSCSASVGWSFSYMEPKASVVVYGTANQGGQDFYTTCLAEIVIVFLSGVPKSIAPSITEPQIVWNHLLTNDESIFGFGTGIMNAPNDSGTCIVTQDWHPPRSAAPVNYRCIDAPIHIYYSPGKINPTLVKYNYETVAAVVENRTAITKAKEYFTIGEGSKSIGAYVKWGFSTAEISQPVGMGSKNNNYTDYAVGDNVGPPAHSYGMGRSQFGLNINAYCGKNPTGVHGATVAYEWYLVQFKWVVVTTKIENDTEAAIGSMCTLIPGDIEATIILKSESTPSGSGSTSYSHWSGYEPISVGTSWTDGVGNRVGSDTHQFQIAYGCGDTITSNPYYLQFSPGWAPFSDISPAEEDHYGGFIWRYSSAPWKGVTTEVISCGNTQFVIDNQSVTITDPTPTSYNNPLSVGNIRIYLISHHSPIMLEQAMWSHQLSIVHYEKEKFAVSHSSSAFNPKKYYSYDKTVNKQVVVMGAEEYNQTNAVTGWIGVV